MSSLQDDPHVVAYKLGLDCVLPKPGELHIDIDDNASAKHLTDMTKVLIENEIKISVNKNTASRGGDQHRHIYVQIEAGNFVDDPVMRIALQACLGSDRKRELLSLLRILLDTGVTPTCFFEESDE